MKSVWVALVVAVVGMAGVAYEIAGLTLPGRHTISYSAHRSRPLRLVIFGGFIFGAAWWWWHSGQEIVR
jgi:hypothetical protein